MRFVRPTLVVGRRQVGEFGAVPILVTRDEADQLELEPGRLVWLRVTRQREFAA